MGSSSSSSFACERRGCVSSTKVSSSCKDVIVAQFTSFASLNEKYRNELKSSFSPGLRSDNDSMGPTEFEIVWPTWKEVENSIYGLSSGGVMPGSLKNAQAVLKDGALRTWCSDRSDVRESSMVSERRRAMPHIKTFSRASADGKVLDWSILTSVTSKAAGCIQNENAILYQSWEMGILFLRPHYDCPLHHTKLRQHSTRWRFR